MLEKILEYIKGLDDIWIILVASIFSFLENIFPPLPSDLIVIASSSLLKQSGANSITLFFTCTIFSTLGFLTVYSVGVLFEKKFMEERNIRFIDPKLLSKAHSWFEMIGYHLILINRFFPGIRSVIALFSGINRLSLIRVFILSLVSSLIWNGLLIFAGYTLSSNWEVLQMYLSNYTYAISGIVIILFIVFGILKYKKGNK